jgi:hypothetical protein
MTVAQTIGIEMPGDFPTAAYNAVNIKLGPLQPTNPALWAEYASGWNSVAIRFKTTTDADVAFTRSIKQGTAPSHDERQLQEESLFTFFVAGLAVIESFSYALFAIASMKRPADFPMSATEQRKNIRPDVMRQKYSVYFPGSPVNSKFSALLDSPEYREWRDIRNILSHRQAPPRQHYVGGSANGTATWQVLQGLVLNDVTTTARRTWLANEVAGCIHAAESFVNANFP